MNNPVILHDEFEKTLLPILSMKPFFGFQNGIFSEIERAGLQNRQIVIGPNSLRDPDFYGGWLKSQGIEKQFSIDKITNAGEPATPDSILAQFPKNLVNDLLYLKREDFNSGFQGYLCGNTNDLWIHNEAVISPMAEINTENGPVIIDKKARISSFCIISGPAYIGPGSVLDRVSFSNSRAGTQCRLGGEISDSVIGSFTNKHHEGFLGHSIVGDWVNLGAITTTSDLKNNYGEISLRYENISFATKRIKFGSIIGDYVKTGIGTMLNTGTILDTGSLVFEGFENSKYFPPFFWGGEEASIYRLEKFLADITKIMARRNRVPDNFVLTQLARIHRNATG